MFVLGVVTSSTVTSSSTDTAPPRRRRRRLFSILMCSVTYTGRIAGHGGTSSVFIGRGDRVGGRDTGDTSSSCRLLLFLQNFFKLLLHLSLIHDTTSSSPA